MKYAHDAIPLTLIRRHRRARHVLDSVYDSILATPPDKFTALTPADLLARADATPEEADEFLRALWRDIRVHKTLDRRIRRRIGDVFESISQHLAIYRFADGRSANLGSRLFVPPDVATVILDATAELNPSTSGQRSMARAGACGPPRGDGWA